MPVLLGLAFYLAACAADGGLGVSAPDFSLPYAIAAPSQQHSLHPKVQEISGITCSPDPKKLLAVQDEQGQVFQLDRTHGGLGESVPFWKDGDYEGIARAGEEIYVLKNTGTLYGITHFGTPQQEVAKYNDFLNDEFDAEGLAYDPGANRLLIACKGEGEGPYADPFTRLIFAFDLAEKKLDSIPAFQIRKADIYAFLQANDTLPYWPKMIDDFEPGVSEMEFNPSGLGVHPATGHLYLISSAGKKMLMVMDRSGRILYVTKLPKQQHRQPEGLCFDEEGRLYIANEGKGVTPPMLYLFERLPNPEGQ